MRIIDFHAHAYPDHLAARALKTLLDSVDRGQAHTDGTVAGLRASMQKNGIAKSVLLSIATKPSHVPKIADACKAWLAPDIMPFGSLHPASVTMDEDIRRLKDCGLRGVKLHPEFQDFHVDDRKVFPMYEALSAAGLITVFHAGNDPGPFTSDHGLPPAFKTVHLSFPCLKMVLAHMGGWQAWDEVDRHTAALQIFFDTSSVMQHLPKEAFLKLARKHGTERILFGSDSPWFEPADDLRWLDSAGLSSDELERILHKNAEALLGS
ncbi:MAG TPA: amidohydrolase [Elusimicrobia bacterium]|nr:amidohydrolase [Elusimicrobiota bacterium]